VPNESDDRALVALARFCSGNRHSLTIDRQRERWNRFCITPVAVMRPSIANVCAAWLIALFALPFTAPFPTCDVGGFFVGTGHHDAIPLAPPVRSRSTVLEDGTYSVLPTLTTESGRLKLAVVSQDRAPALDLLVLHQIRSISHAPAWPRPVQEQPSAASHQMTLRI
jgi:hypothetical protein